MTKSDLLTQIASRAHCDGYVVGDSTSRYHSQVADAFREAINELSFTVPLSDIQYLVKETSLPASSGKVSIPSDFARLIFMEGLFDATSSKVTCNFMLIDNALWQNILSGDSEDSDFDPPAGTIYYYINGSDILFHKESDINGQTVVLHYVAGAYPDSWSDQFEMTQEAGKFTEKFVTLVKNRAVEILTAELRGEM